MAIKVAINGFGRIGRNVLKAAIERGIEDFEIVAINDGVDSKSLAHLLKYDSCFGKFNGTVEATADALIINGKEVKKIKEFDPEKLPWKELGVDIVIESTGLFTAREGAAKHIAAGAKKVIISAPAKNEDVTIVMGVNEDDYIAEKHNIISNASCTTNCVAPFAKVISDKFGIKRGLMTTVHSYTNDQKILDAGHSDLRRARAAAESIIPTTTGATKAVGKVIPELVGKLDGMAMRVPTPTVSLVDMVFELNTSTTVEELNIALKEAADGQLQGILGYSDEPLVSIDYRKDPRSSIIDSLSTMILGDNLVKIVSWYDNEWGYSNRVVDLTSLVISKGL